MSSGNSTFQTIKAKALKHKDMSIAIACILIGGPIYLAGNLGDKPADLIQDMQSTTSSEEFNNLSRKVSEFAQIDDQSFVGCNDNCKSQLVELDVKGFERTGGKFPFRGKVITTDDKHGIDANLWNVSYNKGAEEITVKIGGEETTFKAGDIGAVDFKVQGWFVESHLMNHDVKGLVVGFSINQERMQALKDERAALAKFEASFPLGKKLTYFSDGTCKDTGEQHCLTKADLALICESRILIMSDAHSGLTLFKPRNMRGFLEAGSQDLPVFGLSNDGNECQVIYNVTGIYNGSDHVERVFGHVYSFERKGQSFYAYGGRSY